MRTPQKEFVKIGNGRIAINPNHLLSSKLTQSISDAQEIGHSTRPADERSVVEAAIEKRKRRAAKRLLDLER